MNLTKTKYYTILNDTYNANPDSVKSVLKTISSYQERKVAILGDMLELGTYEKELHESVGEYLNGKIDVLITIGSLSKHINDKFNGEKYHFNNIEEVEKQITSILKPNDYVVLKASHSMRLDELANYLTSLK